MRHPTGRRGSHGPSAGRTIGGGIWLCAQPRWRTWREDWLASIGQLLAGLAFRTAAQATLGGVQEVRLEAAFDAHGRIPRSTLSALDWPDLPYGSAVPGVTRRC